MHSKAFTIAVFSCSVLCLAVFYLLQLNGYNVWHYVRYSIVWLPFYYSGILIRSNWICLDRFRIISIVLFFVTLLFEVIEAFLLWKTVPDSSDMLLSQVKITSLLNSAAIALIMFSQYKKEIKHGTFERLFVYLGNNSFGIFFVHCIYITAFKIVFDRFEFLATIPLPITRIIECVIVVALSLLTIKIIKLIFRSKSALLFGV